MRLIQSIDYTAIAPPVIVALTAVAVLVADLFVPRLQRTAVASTLSLAGTLSALGTAGWLAAQDDRRTLCFPDRSCSFVSDGYTAYFQVLVLAEDVVVPRGATTVKVWSLRWRR